MPVKVIEPAINPFGIDVFVEAILKPIVNKLAEGVANEILYGSNLQTISLDAEGNLNVENFNPIRFSGEDRAQSAGSAILSSGFEYQTISYAEMVARYPERK